MELRAFVAVAEELHFSRAATRLGMAPPPLSQIIRRLEEKLGAVLFERTPRSVRLTPPGAELLPRARDILARMAQAQEAVAAQADDAPGELRLGIAVNGFAELNGPIVSAFRALHPAMRVTLRDVTTATTAAVASGVVDVALVRPPLPDHPEVVVQPIVSEARALLVSEHHRLAAVPTVRLAETLDDPFVAVGPAWPQVRDYWAASAERGGPPRAGVAAWSIPQLLHAVSEEDNVTTAFPSLLRTYPVSGVVSVALEDVSPAHMAIALRPEEPRPHVRDFVGVVHAVCTEMVALVPDAELLALQAGPGPD